MATPRIPEEEAEARFAAIERKLTEGHPDEPHLPYLLPAP